ncbi:hypothetical protein Mal4_41590 [Maioricimonas rarisocia]|uniref:Uncharacterized protein n=1 Tax=Maioricimonas rarisocia TaxID=2528026 RepID=A0A517ZBK1_9PLAN|nr:hypothetical protein Mal4_41590 [Maioricimonas rarisocia]
MPVAYKQQTCRQIGQAVALPLRCTPPERATCIDRGRVNRQPGVRVLHHRRCRISVPGTEDQKRLLVPRRVLRVLAVNSPDTATPRR